MALLASCLQSTDIRKVLHSIFFVDITHTLVKETLINFGMQLTQFKIRCSLWFSLLLLSYVTLQGRKEIMVT